MRLALALLPAALLVTACGRGPSLPEVDLALRVVPGAEEVEVGRGFPLTVVRAWDKGLVPSEGTERSLAPLVLRLEGTTRREDDRRVEETRRYRAYAFRRADVEVRAPTFAATPKDGGPERRVTAAPLRLRVKATVDPAAPGEPELPGEPLAEPVAWAPWAVAAAVALAALLLIALRRRRRPVAPAPAPVPRPPAPAGLTPAERALEGLRRLRATVAEGGEAMRAQVIEAADLVRVYVAEDLGIPAPRRTTEEVVAATRALPSLAGRGDARLGEVLCGGDLVKFADHEPSSAERLGILDAAEAFVAGAATASAPHRAAP